LAHPGGELGRHSKPPGAVHSGRRLGPRQPHTAQTDAVTVSVHGAASVRARPPTARKGFGTALDTGRATGDRRRWGGDPVRRAPLSLPSASIGGRPPDPQARERNVLITHDTRCALDTVVDLVNTVPEDDAADGLPDVEALADFVRNHKISDVGVLSEFDL